MKAELPTENEVLYIFFQHSGCNYGLQYRPSKTGAVIRLEKCEAPVQLLDHYNHAEMTSCVLLSRSLSFSTKREQ